MMLMLGEAVRWQGHILNFVGSNCCRQYGLGWVGLTPEGGEGTFWHAIAGWD